MRIVRRCLVHAELRDRRHQTSSRRRARSSSSRACRVGHVDGDADARGRRLPVVTDGIRAADVSNPERLLRVRAVKELDKDGDTAWLREARGKAVKIISFLLTYLPETYDYQVIFMQRDLDEVLASQKRCSSQRGEADRRQLEQRRRQTLRPASRTVMRFLRNRACFNVLAVNYRDAMARPEVEARTDERLSRRKARRGPDERRSDPSLYRNRRARARRRQKLLRCQRRSDTKAAGSRHRLCSAGRFAPPAPGRSAGRRGWRASSPASCWSP